jgi:hypothetical protein
MIYPNEAPSAHRLFFQSLLLVTGLWIFSIHFSYFLPDFLSFLSLLLSSLASFPFGALVYAVVCLPLFALPSVLLWSWGLPFVTSVYKMPRKRVLALSFFVLVSSCTFVYLHVYAPKTTEIAKYVSLIFHLFLLISFRVPQVLEYLSRPTHYAAKGQKFDNNEVKNMLADVYFAHFWYLWPQNNHVYTNLTQLGAPHFLATFNQYMFNFLTSPFYFKGEWKEVA